MKKRIFVNLLAALLLVMALAPAGLALEEAHIADGTCGEGITWSLDGYTLTITGSGEMDDGCPWIEHIKHIEHVVLEGGITKIGKEAFYKFDRIETVEFGDSLVEIGQRAFAGCEDIDYIHLPATFRTFGAEAFRDCVSLKYVYCDGGMPRFNDSCLWTGNYIAVFYPGNNPWPAEAVNQLVHNFGGRLGIMMGSFDESAVAENLEALEETGETEEAEETEETEEETTEETAEETTEETVEETEAATEATEETEAETVMATEPETEPTTEETAVPTETTLPETEPATQATEEPTETSLMLEFEEETIPPDPVDEVGSKSWIGMVMIAGVLTFLISGAMIFRSVSRRGGRYKQ